MTVGPIRGRLLDRPFSAFESQDIKFDLLELTTHLVRTGLAGCWERAVDLGDQLIKRQRTS